MKNFRISYDKIEKLQYGIKRCNELHINHENKCAMPKRYCDSLYGVLKVLDEYGYCFLLAKHNVDKNGAVFSFTYYHTSSHSNIFIFKYKLSKEDFNNMSDNILEDICDKLIHELGNGKMKFYEK